MQERSALMVQTTPDDRPAAAQPITIYSVAEAAGVSIASVSRVLQGSTKVSDTTRAKVMDAVDRLNYMPLAAARSLAVRHHEALGLVLPELRGPYYSELLMGFEQAAADLGLSVLVTLANPGAEAVGPAPDPRGGGARLARLAARVDGLAVMGVAADSATVSRTARQKPLVVLAGTAGPGIESVRAESVESAGSLTRHLIQVHGRSRLLFLGDPAVSPDVRERHDGFRRAVTACGLAPAEPVAIGYREAEGRAVADRLVSGELAADGLVCANDEIALAVMRRLQQAGRNVPEEYAVVGWDDVMTARYVRPGLTTVAQPVREIGALAARRLHERIAGGPVAEPAVLATRVVLRGSCGCADT